MQHSKIIAAAIGIALVGAAAIDVLTGQGVVSSARMIAVQDRSGFKGTDEELEVVSTPDRPGTRGGDRAQGVATTASGNPEGVQATASGSPDG